jgi:hypothetical protein
MREQRAPRPFRGISAPSRRDASRPGVARNGIRAHGGASSALTIGTSVAMAPIAG